MSQEQYRLIKDEDELTIITQDGGVACIRRTFPCDQFPRIAATDYYQMSLSDVDMSKINDDHPIWEALAEGKMYYNDWEDSEWDSPELVNDALEWLGTNPNNAVQNNTLFMGVF